MRIALVEAKRCVQVRGSKDGTQSSPVREFDEVEAQGGADRRLEAIQVFRVLLASISWV